MIAIKGSLWAVTCLTALAAGACVSAAAGEDAPHVQTRAPVPACSAVTESGAPVAFFAVDAAIPPWEPAQGVAVAAGDTIPINIGQNYAPYGMRRIPGQCIEWQIEPAGHASLSEGGERLTIAGDLPLGSVVELTAVIAQEGEPTRTGTLRISIVDEASRQLMGTWSFEEVRGCNRMAIDPPRELRFEPENGVRVAWTVFERYWDYWGRYGWDPQTGAFSLEPTGGNRVPADVSTSGQLVVENARQIAISGFHFGARASDTPSFLVSAEEAGCTLVFRRQR